MVNTLFVLLVGLASSATAFDANSIAEKVITSLDSTLSAHASQWFSLPGFDIYFNNENKTKWHIHGGQVASVGGVERDGFSPDPVFAHYNSDSSSVVVYINIKNLVVDYKFSCEDLFVKSGSSYSISRAVSTQATVIVDIIPEGPSKCRGSIHSAPTKFSYEKDGRDFSKITPDDQYAKQCIIRSYTKRQDYTDRINDEFGKAYGDAVEKMLFSATQAAFSNLNLCS